MTRRLIVLILALAVLIPARPAVAACTTQKDHHCACSTQISSTSCCCTGKEIPAKPQTEAPQAQQADPGILPASVGPTLNSTVVIFEHPSSAGRPLAASPTPLFLLNGSFLN